MAKTDYKKIAHPVTTLDQIGLPSNTVACLRCYGIETAEELVRCISKPDTLRTPGLREKCRQHLLEHGYLKEGMSMENKRYFQVSYEVGNTYSSNIAIAECVDDVVDYYKADGCKGIGVSSITKEEAETSLRRHPGKPVIEIPKQERQKPSIPDELKKSLDMLCFSEDVLEVLYHLNISTVNEIEDRLPEIKKKADFDTYEIIAQAVRTRNAVIKAVPAEPEVTIISAEATHADALVVSGLEMMKTGVIKLCTGVKLMHDGKLYQQFGFQNFEGYCKSRGFSREYGRQLIKIADMLESENANPGWHFENLNFSILKLLTTLESEQRAELAQTVDLETISKRDAEKEVKALKAKHKRELEEQKAALEKEIKELKETNEMNECTLNSYRHRNDELMEENWNITEERTELKNKIQELENRPPQVEYMQSVAELQRIEELEGQNELITNEYNELDEENKQLRAELQEAHRREQEANAKAQEILDDSADATEELERLREENAMLEKQLSEGGSFREQKAELNAYMKMLDKTMMSICGFIARNKHTPEARSCLDLVEHKIGQYLNPLKEEK